MNASSKKKLNQYERLAGMLRDRIAAGIYARGDKLPSEMELMDESGLSRSTVRQPSVSTRANSSPARSVSSTG